jgi:transcriptional regulator of arginine metabolism
MTAAKQQRQRLIADWLRQHRIGSQEELVARLDLAGVSATQATVSRDLDELGAVRVRGGGAMHYRLADQAEATGSGRLDRLLAEWVTDIVPAGNLVVLRTPPGSANLVANAIDAARIEEVAGTIAGDDTIFVALVDGVLPGAFAEGLRRRRDAR